MKRFLVPTDFSDTSKNAARYAVQMLAGKPDVKIILYYIYDAMVAGSDGSLLTEDEIDRTTILGHALANLKLELAPYGDVDMEGIAEQGTSLVENIERFVRHHGIDMVVMGITGATKLDQILMGSNTLKLVNAGVCPVMIIPPDANYRDIKQVALTSDFKDVEGTIPFASIKRLLNLFKPTLHIINVDSDHYVEITEDYKTERRKLEKHFGAYSPQFAFMRLYDFLDAVNNYTKDNQIDLIITIPKKHSFLGSFFKTSHTTKLAYHSTVPVVAVHE